MTKLLCPDCQVEFQPKKNGVHVIEMFLNPPEPYKVYGADLWACPICGKTVITGFSWGVEHFEEEFADHLKVALANDPYYIYER